MYVRGTVHVWWKNGWEKKCHLAEEIKELVIKVPTALAKDVFFLSSWNQTMSSDWNEEWRTGRSHWGNEKKAFIRVRRRRIEQNRCVCECTFCTQNVRMIYFHIWFVCASSSNVIHFRWNFLCTATSTSAHFLYRAQSTMKPFTVCQGTYSYSVLCCCCLVFFSSFHCSLPHNLNLFGFPHFFSLTHFAFQQTIPRIKYSTKQTIAIFPFICNHRDGVAFLGDGFAIRNFSSHTFLRIWMRMWRQNYIFWHYHKPGEEKPRAHRIFHDAFQWNHIRSATTNSRWGMTHMLISKTDSKLFHFVPRTSHRSHS